MASLAIRTAKILILFGYFFQGFLLSLGYVKIVFPSEEEYIIESQSNIAFKCEADHPITWSYPNLSEAEEKWSSFKIFESNPSEAKFSAVLEIKNISYLDTGFYNCHEKEEGGEARQIYLYVRDETHLAASKDNEIVNVVQGSEAILPCRPTSPDVQVELMRSTGDKNLIGKVDLNVTNEEGMTYTYDPRYGFLINQVTHDVYQIYDCIFKNGHAIRTTVLLDVQIMTEPVEKPFIQDLKDGHTVVGETVKLACNVISTGRFAREWSIPNPRARTEGRVVERESKRILIIKNATLEDKGIYTCLVKDYHHEVNNSLMVQVYDVNEHFLELSEENDVYEISVLAGEKANVTWAVDVKGHPIPQLTWYNNRNETIHSDPYGAKFRKYNVTVHGPRAILVIYNVTISDRGYYELRARNFEEKSLKLFLNVSGKPTLNLEKQDFYVINKDAPAKCSVSAFPKADVFWKIKMCPDNSCSFQPATSTEREKSDFEIVSTVTINPNSSGIVVCYANNSLGEEHLESDFTVTDVEHGFSVWGLDDYTLDSSGRMYGVIASGETITLYCGATVHSYTDQLFWYRDSDTDFNLIETTDRHTVEKSHTAYSYRTKLKMYSVGYNDSGNYTCRGQLISDDLQEFKYAYVTINVTEPKAPVIVRTNLNGNTYERSLPEPMELVCAADGVPKPRILWLKNKVALSGHLRQNRIKMVDHDRRLIFLYTEAEDEGEYSCVAENSYGSIERSTNLKFTNKPVIFRLYHAIIIGILAVLFLSVSVCVCVKIQKEKKLKRELKSIGLMNFEKGALENLNPELGIDDQAELLPYDNKFEFPREKLKLGKQLGAGAFGVVLKAEARGIVEGEDVTTVAVKMVKRNAEASYIKALASELKIMVHLGKHLNVVNLLGACTKNAAKTRELLVIVEFCRYGNIHNFLIRHRQNFINQIDPKTKRVDFSIGSDVLERTLSVSSNRSDVTNTSNNAAEMRGGNSALSYGTSRTMSTTVCMSPTGDSEDGLITSNNSSQPEWRSNYRGDYKSSSVKPISTKDLISWAFQVARGMEYLASRKVLHGDLAARNVLLAENGVVKICDFGLAKSIYKSNNYQKKGDGPLPVKWMAIESIRDRIFSTQSDVWSFGIVLWEFFSLARTPYPGMEADERLYQKLVDGYRMDPPEFATKEIYQMMLDCWNANPTFRPTFTRLSHEIGLMLEESVRQHYIDLNDPYLKMNTCRLKTQEDYLAMLSPPDFINLSTPNHYVNESVITEKEAPVNCDTPGYLCMKPSPGIFSPTPRDAPAFVFDTNRKPKDAEGRDGGVELVPMLSNNNESDTESMPTSPSYETSFSNPTYHLPPAITSPEEGGKIIHSTNNYVNIPQSKNSALKSMNSHVGEKGSSVNNSTGNLYVNSTSRDWERVAT